MVKGQNKNNAKVVINQGESGFTAKASKIRTSIPYENCSKRLSTYGGIFRRVKFVIGWYLFKDCVEIRTNWKRKMVIDFSHQNPIYCARYDIRCNMHQYELLHEEITSRDNLLRNCFWLYESKVAIYSDY